MAHVITDPQNGVLIGLSMGLAFWTALDCAGQHRVCTFEDEAEAKDFAEQILANGMDVSAFTYVEVDTAQPFAGADHLLKAGLVEPANALMRAQLENAEPSEFRM